MDGEVEVKTVDSIIRKLMEDIKEKNSLEKDENFVDYLSKSSNNNEIENLFKKDNLKINELRGKQFQYLLDKLVLSSSPFVKYRIPYLLSEKGYKECTLKRYLPASYINYYHDSNILLALNFNEKLKFKTFKKNISPTHNTNDSLETSNNDGITNYEKKFKETHEFLKIHLIKSANDDEIKVKIITIHKCEHLNNYYSFKINAEVIRRL